MNKLTTEGITISVVTRYEPVHSRPDNDYFSFSYQINIKNEGSETVQLLRRHWFITDANAELREVEGPGVVGEQPVLKPGDSHSYTSWCPLATPFGQMGGYYLMQRMADGSSFKAKVPDFTFTAEFLLN